MNYQYSPYVWPMLTSIILMAVLGLFASRRRRMPGASAFILLMTFRALWAIGAAFYVLASDAPTHFFWRRFEILWFIPTATACLCLAMELANLRHWLTRRNLILLGAVPVLAALLITTNDAHHLMWADLQLTDIHHRDAGVVGIFFIVYATLVILINFYILFWLLTQSRPYQWAVGALLLAQVLSVALYYLDDAGMNPFAPMDASTLVFNVGGILYLLAIFRLGLFSILPIARETVLAQMQEGMLVLDPSQQIVDLNPAAEKILGVRAVRVRGKPVATVLPTGRRWNTLVSNRTVQSEMSVGTGDSARHYAVEISFLTDRRGTLLGQVILLHDVTEQKRAQEQIVDQQRALGMLQERERLARELHDSVGQVLGYVSLQAQAIEKLVHDGKMTNVEQQITRLADVARDAHADLRESILNLRTGVTAERSLVPTLRQYLASFQENYGIRTEFVVPEGIENAIGADEGMQVLRVIQEAMSNARRHAQARSVRVLFENKGEQIEIVIADDGCGFDPEHLVSAEGHLGLGMMRERMASIGGSVTIVSHLGAGTRVMLSLPLQTSSSSF